MNYIKELRAFYDYTLYNGVSTGEVALWYTLMSINNRLGWLDEFTVSNLVLQQATSLSRSGLDSARNGLKQRGLIDYRPGKANRAGKYSLIPLVCNISDTAEDTTEDNLRTPQQDTTGHGSGTLTKQKLKQKQNTPYSPPEKEPTIKSVSDRYAAEGPVREALDGFVEMRKKKGPFTVRALELSLKKLDSLAAPYGDRAEEAKAAILNQSTERCWSGVFELKDPLPDEAKPVQSIAAPPPLTAEEAQSLSLEELLG